MYKEFKLAMYVKPIMLLFIVVASIITVGVIFNSAHDVFVLAIFAVILAFIIYLVRVFLAINGDTFRKIAIDNVGGRFLLITKKGETLALPFDSVSGVYMTQGEVMRGIRCGHVTLQTKDNKVYGVTISRMDSFYLALPVNVEKQMEEGLFYLPRWNKVGK